MVLQHSSVENPYIGMLYNNDFVQFQSRDFPTKLCCNTMVLQHSSVENPYIGMLYITMILFNAKVGIFPPSYAIIPWYYSIAQWEHPYIGML